MKTFLRIVGLAVLFGQPAAQAQLVTYGSTTPGGLQSSAYTVKVRRIPNGGTAGAWQDLAEYKKKVNSGHGGGGGGNYETQEATLVYFDNDFSTGKVEVQVKVNYTTATLNSGTVRIRPASASIAPANLDNAARTFTFQITQARNLSVEIKEGTAWNIYRNLHVFAGPPASAPAAGAIEYAAGVHTLPGGQLSLQSGQKVYIHGGAVVKGTFLVDGKSDVDIRGRGIIYIEGANAKESATGCIKVINSTNVTVGGVIALKDKASYAIWAAETNGFGLNSVKVISSGQYGDGIHTLATTGLTITNSFVRSSDDCIPIYASRPDWSFGPRGDSRNHTISNTVLWADVAHPIQIGTHGSQNAADRDIIENITFQNIDILEHDCAIAEFQGCMSINAGDENIIRNITFDGIRVEDFYAGQLFNVRVIKNTYNPRPGYSVSGIRFKNVSYSGSGQAQSIITGYSNATFGTRLVSDVDFENCKVNGTVLTKDNYCNYFDIGSHTSDITFGNQARNTNCGTRLAATDEPTDEATVTVFPNPSRAAFEVRYAGLEARITVRNATGQSALQVRSEGGSEVISTQRFAPGLHTVEVVTPTSRTVRKLVIQK
jgi:hypothetical protein